MVKTMQKKYNNLVKSSAQIDGDYELWRRQNQKNKFFKRELVELKEEMKTILFLRKDNSVF